MTPVVANILQPLIDVADVILRFWHDEVGLGWGMSIVMLTVVVRIAILPLTYKGIKGMQNMQRLAPEMKKLQERYKDDKQRQQQEMMKFYQEHGFNPASSCLPLLLQIPFFISLFYLLRDDKFEQDIRGEESFLIIDNLAEPESGLVLVVLALIFVATQLAAGLVTAFSADRNQRILMLVLPVVFVPIMISFESGLIVYWITTNIWTFGQQLAVKKFLPAPEPLAPAEGDDKQGSRGAPTKTAKPAGPAAATADGGEAPKRRSLLAAAGASGGTGSDGDGSGGADAGDARRPPPPSPRKKKKRSGRRR